ncbi:unnamed protein product [marine sediment metagenome]|uniref:Uncharacterized protein n=1 Tax=marine sediment metagenome TaxID=412755 RepID=X1TR48_9ZZZZ
MVHEYAEEAHAAKITPINNINPKKSSSHLFIVYLLAIFYLKRL